LQSKQRRLLAETHKRKLGQPAARPIDFSPLLFHTFIFFLFVAALCPYATAGSLQRRKQAGQLFNRELN
jgi:hypothetical protein